MDFIWESIIFYKEIDMRLKRRGATQKVDRWTKEANANMIDKIDRKTFAAKTEETKLRVGRAVKDILIDVGEYTLQIITAAQNEDACERCCFALLGKSTGNCPKINYGGDEFHMCTCFGSGKREYFIEAGIDNKSLFEERRA